jgi:hypothetical protein
MGLFDWFKKTGTPSSADTDDKVTSYRLECSADFGSGPVPVFPLLMPETWQRAPKQVCRPIISGVALPGIPVVALAYLIPAPGSSAPQRGFIRKERVDQIGKTVRDFELEALHNVAARPASWSQMNMGEIAVASCTDDYLAAEHILDPVFIEKAHQMLADRRLLVAIPARGQLHATSLARALADTRQAIMFKTVVEKMFQEAGEPGITPWPFIVIDGHINSVAELS